MQVLDDLGKIAYDKLRLPFLCKRLVNRCLRKVYTHRLKAAGMLSIVHVHMAGASLVLPGPEKVDRRTQRKRLENLLKDRDVCKDAEGLGPRAALKKKMQTLFSDEEKRLFVESARLDAILGSCPGSLPSLRSGVRCYISFADAMGHIEGTMYLPPVLNMILTWPTFFDQKGPLQTTSDMSRQLA